MEITEIKLRLGMEGVLQHYGLRWDKHKWLRCPFHEDTTPSMQVYPKSNTWCCFSANCTAGTGDVIQFIQLKERTAINMERWSERQHCALYYSNANN